MNHPARVFTVTWPVAAMIALALLGAGGLVVYLALAGRTPLPSRLADGAASIGEPRDEAMPERTTGSRATEPAGEVAVTIPPDVVARAGIETAPVESGGAPGSIQVPAAVEPHGYRQVVVTPLAAGRVTRVQAQLGEEVTRGRTMAEIYSPELASAQTAYISAGAALEAARARRARAERLVQIGAASRQELEGARAEEARLATEQEAARARLLLLGMTPPRVQQLTAAGEITSTIAVPAPISGVVTARDVNVGLNVDPSSALFTVVDLSSVWVVGNVYERDLGLVQVGAPARVTTDAYPGMVLDGRVSYIDPQVEETTRTARVRVEVDNRSRRLRLGMYVTLAIARRSGAEGLLIPADAVQTVGPRQVVYVVDPKEPGRFIEREIAAGQRAGGKVEVLTGLSAGDVIVSKGSFFVRAERERLQPVRSEAAEPVGTGVAARDRGDGVTISVTERGFEPARVTIPRGARTPVTFIRRTDNTCATEVVIPSLGLRRALPLNEPVTVVVDSSSGQELTFACGMNMFKGTLVGAQ